MGTGLMPITLPDVTWQHSDVRRALKARDMGALFRFVQHHTGASQARIAVATAMTQGRVNRSTRNGSAPIGRGWR